MRNLETDIYARLMEAAEGLASLRGIPLDIGELCRLLGVAVGRTRIGHARALLVDAKKNPKILLPPADQAPEKYTPWERFLIAHELGHLVLHHRSVPKPQGPGEYWKTEQLCDAFARWLLIPESRFGELGKRAANTAAQRLNFVRYLESKTEVNWAAAAMRVTDWHPNVIFLQLRRESERTLKVCFSSTRKELNRKIAITEPLAAVLISHRTKDTVEALAADVLECFPSVSGASSCVVMRGPKDFRLAAVFDPRAEAILVDNRDRGAVSCAT